MRRTMLRLLVMYLMFLIAFGKYSTAGACPAKDHPTFKVEIAPGLASEHGSGRLIIMMSAQANSQGGLAPSYGPDAHSVWVAAKEVYNLTPQKPVELDPDELAYPDKFCSAQVPAGSCRIAA